MVGMDSLIAVDGCFSSNHAALRGKSKELLAWNQDNMAKSVNNRKTVTTVMTLTWYRHF
jgi:hypothetical protein